MRKLALAVLLILVVSHAENYVVVNSFDGRDVLSGIFYANVKDYPVKFMPSQEGDPYILAAKIGYSHEILLIQSEELPVSAFLQEALGRYDNDIDLYPSTDGAETNLDLALRSGANKFIIVESAFSDGALSAIPYAKMKKAYILLTNEDNIDDVKDIVRNADEIIIYGYVDSSVRTALAEFDPVTIGKGEDRYEDNVEMAEIMFDQYDVHNIIMTEGTFVEEGMVDGGLPIVFSGRIVPSVTYEFVKEKTSTKELKLVYLIGGTKITNAVKNMRSQIKAELGLTNSSFGIWMRFAQIIPGTTGMMTLDNFYLPAYIPELEISDVVYNTATGNMMITIDNVGAGPAFYITEIHILVNEEEYQIFGDDEAALVEKGDTVGLEYPLDLSEIEEGEVTAVVIVKYGSGTSTLEEYADYIGGLVEIDYNDQSNVSAREARYDTSREIVYLSIKNNKEEVAYVSPDIELSLDGEPTTIHGPYNEPVEGNSIIVVEFPVELSSEDLAANDEITVNMKYGGRPGFLVKESTGVLPLEKEGFDFLVLLLILLIVLLVILAIYLIWKNRKKGEH